MTKSILAKTATGEIQLTITVPVSRIRETYNQALEEIAQRTEIPGFRKGKAPKELVEEKVGKAEIYERAIQNLVPRLYVEAIEEHHLKPIIAPKVELLKAEEGKDWEIRITTCEKPEIKLGKYKEEIRKALSPAKLWTPRKKFKRGEKPDSQEDTEDEKTQKVIEKILEITQIVLPKMLIDDEVNRALSHLINQTNSLGLTIDQYLASINKTSEQIRAEYEAKVSDQLKLQFALDEIAEQENIRIEDEEVDDLIKATADETLRQNLDKPIQREYLRGILRRKKILDFLAKL